MKAGWCIGVGLALVGCEVAPLPPLRDAGELGPGPSEGDARDERGDGDVSAPGDVDAAWDGGDGQAGPALIALAEAWREVAAGADPYAADRPIDVAPCDPAGVLIEAGTFELDTALCDWASFEQPLRVGLEAGARVEVVFWYGVSSPDTPAGEALAALHLGDGILWQARVGLPAAGGLLFETVTVPEAHAAGERLVFHLHNHGANTWTLGSVSRLP